MHENSLELLIFVVFYRNIESLLQKPPSNGIKVEKKLNENNIIDKVETKKYKSLPFESALSIDTRHFGFLQVIQFNCNFS